MTQRFLQYKNSRICYYHFGKGPRQVVCFHGYAEEARLYSFFEKWAGGQFRFLAIDLPFHGGTEWNDGLNFTAEDLQAIVKNILTENQVPSSPLILMGFSLGGRIALSLYQADPQAVEKLILMAPDGLKVNFWYWLSTQTLVGNRLFRYSMKNPGWFFAFLKMLNKLGWVNASIFKFVNYYIGNNDARQLLYQRWTCMRKLKPDLPRIKQNIREHKIPVRLIYGKFDRIILPARGERFRQGIEPFCELIIIQSGHQVLHEHHAEQLLPALLH